MKARSFRLCCVAVNTSDPEGVGDSCGESRSGGAWRGVIAKEDGIAVVIAYKQIKIAVPVDISKSWARTTLVSSYFRNPEGRVFTFLGISGSIRRTGVAEEKGVTGVIADEEIEIVVIVDIGKGWAGVTDNLQNPEGKVSAFLDVSRSRCAYQASSGPGGVD